MLCYYPKTGHTFKHLLSSITPLVNHFHVKQIKFPSKQASLLTEDPFFVVLSFCFQLLIKPGGNQKRKRSEVSFSLCSSLLHQDVSETSRPPSFVSVHVLPGHMWLQVCRPGSASGQAGQRRWIDEGSEVTAQEEPR